jgi:ferredoxin
MPMIMYFSGTGNSRFVAASLARLLDDKVVDLKRLMHDGDTRPLSSEKAFVLCMPVYVDGMPLAIYRHLRATPLQGNRKAYAVVTMGSYAGIAGRQAEELFSSKQMEFKGCAEVVMPRNYLVGFAPDEKPESIEEKIKAAPDRIAQIAGVITREAPYEGRHTSEVEYRLVLPFIYLWDKVAFPTRKFVANDACTSCGMCERTCPMRAIRMEDGVPMWVKRHCMHCMACIQNCPARAIGYGKALQRKQRYRLGKYRHVLEDGSGEHSR